MSTSAGRTDLVGAEAQICDVALRVQLSDGREVSVPLEWFPRLAAATREAREHWSLDARRRPEPQLAAKLPLVP